MQIFYPPAIHKHTKHIHNRVLCGFVVLPNFNACVTLLTVSSSAMLRCHRHGRFCFQFGETGTSGFVSRHLEIRWPSTSDNVGVMFIELDYLYITFGISCLSLSDSQKLELPVWTAAILKSSLHAGQSTSGICFRWQYERPRYISVRFRIFFCVINLSILARHTSCFMDTSGLTALFKYRKRRDIRFDICL